MECFGNIWKWPLLSIVNILNATELFTLKWSILGTSLAVQWLRLHASTAGGMGSIPGGGTKIPQATGHGQKINNNNNKSFCLKKQLILLCAFHLNKLFFNRLIVSIMFKEGPSKDCSTSIYFEFS